MRVENWKGGRDADGRGEGGRGGGGGVRRFEETTQGWDTSGADVSAARTQIRPRDSLPPPPLIPSGVQDDRERTDSMAATMALLTASTFLEAMAVKERVASDL